MKYLDKVKLIKNKKSYNDNNIFEGEEGVIWEPEIRNNSFHVMFHNNDKDWYKYGDIKIKDLQIIEDGHCLDETILEDLPKNNPEWWCKVEDGFIMNLNGDKKNKIPYDYDS